MDALCVASRVSKSSVRKATTSTRATTSTKVAKTTSGARSKKSPSAGDVPATREMLGAVRDELLERIDQSREEARSDFSRLDGKIDAVKAELKAEIGGVKADIHDLKAGQARMLFLIEEQNARNKIVLDAIAAMMSWRTEVDQRLDDVERTVRSLVTARPVREPA